ncbi:MAG: hypothetical protein ACI4W7_03060, partial [Candidatus Spyradenecus sp.]
TPPEGVSLGKKRPLRESDLAEFECLASAGPNAPLPDSPNAWTLDPATLDPQTLDLSVRNPHLQAETLPPAADCLARLRALHAELDTLLKDLAQ